MAHGHVLLCWCEYASTRANLCVFIQLPARATILQGRSCWTPATVEQVEERTQAA